MLYFPLYSFKEDDAKKQVQKIEVYPGTSYTIIKLNLMTVDIEKLLSLSSEEKRLIAETLWDSLLSEDENEDLTAEEKQLLQQRWNALQNGESKLHNREDVKARIIRRV